MSKLYLTASTDMVKTEKTVRANKNISVAMGFDPGDYSKKIYATLLRDDDKITLEVETMNKKLLVCEGTVQDGITQCQPYSHAGPYPWLVIKR